MKEIERKFVDDTLTTEELDTLRSQVNAMDDMELGEILRHSWDDYMTDSDMTSISSIYERVSTRISRSYRHYPICVVLIVATVMLLFFSIMVSFFLVLDNRELGRNRITQIMTPFGKQASVLLPDGSKIDLNDNSHLSYGSTDFQKGKRGVAFQGEGYFSIVKDSIHPFLIEDAQIRVEVTGTRFNLNNSPDAVILLALEVGSVKFTSKLTNEQIVMKPHDVVALDRSTGKLKMAHVNNVKDYAAWRHNEIIFRNKPLYSVLNRLERVYRCHFSLRARHFCSDHFTGTLPTDNMSEVIKTLSLTYHLKVIKTPKEIIFE